MSTSTTRLIEGAFYWTMFVQCFADEGETLVHSDRVQCVNGELIREDGEEVSGYDALMFDTVQPDSFDPDLVQALDASQVYHPNSPFWDSAAGQDALAVLRQFNMRDAVVYNRGLAKLRFTDCAEVAA